MKYFSFRVDSYGYTYSIDNCIFEYTLKYPNLKDDLITFLYGLQSRHKITDEFWTRLNLKPCSHWSWCSDVCHLCNGIYLSIGKWNYIKDKDTPVYVPVVKLEVNLNKHSEKEILSDLLQWLKDYCVSCYLVKYDLAVDIPKPKEDIDIFGSRQERGLYKGTRYFGQRNQHGYMKIYDKAKEQEEETILTRVETTLVYKKGMRFNDLYVKQGEFIDVKTNTTYKAIIAMLSALAALGEDQEKYINMLDKRAKRNIKELLSHGKYQKYVIDSDLVQSLLEDVRKFVPFQDLPKYYFEDVNGFLKVDENYSLPFE